jgi:diketogulonate reductase-like aldo/keto reductase
MSVSPTVVTRRRVLSTLAAASAGVAIGLRSPFAAEDRPAMHTRPIPKSGEALPVIGLGTYRAFDVGPTAAERAPLAEVLAAFARGGGRLIDSSPMYGRSESVVGDLTEKLGLRRALFLATKVWTEGREEGIRQMEASFKKMCAGTMDLMQIHNLVDWRTHLATLRGWKAAGRIRYLGITHYRVDAFDSLESILKDEDVDFVQLNYSIGTRDAEKRLLPLAAGRGVAVIVNRPFEDGGLFRAVRGKALPGWAAEIGCASWAQVFLKFIVSHPAVTCAIPATDKLAHLEDNFGAGFGPLPDAALRVRMAAEFTG